MAEPVTIARLGYPRFESINEEDYSNSNYITDITNGLMINFRFTYEWTDINTCQITHIAWRPCKFNNNGTLDIDGSNDNVIEFAATGFKQKKLKVQFGDTQVTTSNNELFNLDIILNDVYNQTITLSNISAKYIPVIFKYEHINENGRTYSLEIPNIKIPKPSRYEENVIFNKDGLNEMIDHFQKYPVIDISSTKTNDAETTGKFGYIRITHGDSSKSADVPIRGFKASTSQNLYCDTDFLPDWHGNQTIGHSWRKVIPAENYNTLTDHTTEKREYIPFRSGYVYYIKNNDGTYTLAPDNSGEISQTYFNNNWGTIENPTFYRRSMWYGIYPSQYLGDADNPVNYIYGNNGIFSNSIKGNLTGGSISIGGTTNNPKFHVDEEGNVTMDGSITWGNGNPLKQIYHRGVTDGTNEHAQPELPSQSQSYDSMSSDGASWHKTYHSTDYWMTFSTDGGKTWQTPTRINAQDGKDGDPGGWEPESIIDALHLIDGDGIFEFDDPVAGSNEIQKLLGIKATAVLAALMEANRIDVNGGSSYSPTDARMFKGGYITFRVPTPWTSKHKLNKSGFSARLGYLRGNGNGAQATAGIGIAIQTQATYNYAFSDNKTEGDKLHLLIASLMLTDSGLGLTLAANTGNYTKESNDTWLTTDAGFSGNYHYVYKYEDGDLNTTAWKLGKASTGYSAGQRGYRLWLHEDNGGLYWLHPEEGFKPWNWED